MKETKRPVNSHESYHAHVYFEQATLSFATSLCEQAGEKFGLKVGRIHQRPVGPHPKWSCQITFGAEHFDEFVPWLEANRQGLTILIHALTGDNLKDHTIYAYWLGEGAELDVSIFGG
ncbi:DOPA 4,5-dioxygenase [Oceanisphaera litoralis]|uniref:DOPA 4,5-dioxygenase family protein n=1 Tax=Oceanisphaera litoralis TaxID=225144 RepID=UPI0019595ABF|nr:DOPA 4,5-dioxygenase family protein [Oceanisphaera litoralis]MBM7457122.1 DOPA 4,5-dioxygenase [Oceanisphaera litoralis]